MPDNYGHDYGGLDDLDPAPTKKGMGEGECYCVEGISACHHHAPDVTDDEMFEWNSHAKMRELRENAALGASLRAALATVPRGRSVEIHRRSGHPVGELALYCVVENDEFRSLAALLRTEGTG